METNQRLAVVTAQQAITVPKAIDQRKQNFINATKRILHKIRGKKSRPVQQPIDNTVYLQEDVELELKNKYDALELENICEGANHDIERIKEADEDMAKLSKPKYVKYKPEKPCVDQCCDALFPSDETQVDMKHYDMELDNVPRRLIAKVAAKKQRRLVFAKLLNFLRCKHFFHYRDTSFVMTLVSDARAWLLRNGHEMDNPIDYGLLSLAVSHAFFVTQEELQLRAMMKDGKRLDHINHLNQTIDGNLGNVSIFGKDGGVLRTLGRETRRLGTVPVRLPIRSRQMI